MPADTASLAFQLSENGHYIAPNPGEFTVEETAFYNGSGGMKVTGNTSNVTIPLTNVGTIKQIVFYLDPIDINETKITLKLDGGSDSFPVTGLLPLTGVTSATVSSSYTDSSVIKELKWEMITE